MSKKINILYLSDVNYAAFAGTSVVSLFENNKHLDEIVVWLIDDDLGEDNRIKFREAAEQYGREVRFLDMSEGIRKLQAIGAPKYRNSYTTYLKLFAFGLLPEDVHRIFFIDSDSVVTGKLDGVLDFDMQGNAVAAVKDVLCRDYMVSLGFPSEDNWYNMGVMLVDVDAWRRDNCEEKIIESMKKRCAYVAVDQDLLNTTLHGKITTLPPCYNTTPHHYVYDHKTVMKAFPWVDFYSEEEIKEAQSAPVIRHFERFLGQSPWHLNNLHPFTKDFDYYMSISPWKDYEKKKSVNTLTFRIERLLYRVLPKKLFVPIFAKFYRRYFKKTADGLLKGDIKNIRV